MKKYFILIALIICSHFLATAQTKAKLVMAAADEYSSVKAFVQKKAGTTDILNIERVFLSNDKEVTILSDKAQWVSKNGITCFYLKVKLNDGRELNVPIANLDIDVTKYGLKVRSFEKATKGIVDIANFQNDHYINGKYIYKSSKGNYIIVNSSVKKGGDYKNSIAIYTLNPNKAEENGIMGYANYKELGLEDSEVKITNTPTDLPNTRLITFLNQKHYSILIHKAKANGDFDPDESDMIISKDIKDKEKGTAWLVEVKSTKVVLYNNEYYIKVFSTEDPFGEGLLNKIFWIDIKDVNVSPYYAHDGNIQIDKENFLVLPFEGK